MSLPKDNAAKAVKAVLQAQGPQAIQARHELLVEIPDELRLTIKKSIDDELLHREMGTAIHHVKYSFLSLPGIGAELTISYNPTDNDGFDRSVYGQFIDDLSHRHIPALLYGRRFSVQKTSGAANDPRGDVTLTGRTTVDLVDGINKAMRHRANKIEFPSFSRLGH